MIQTAFVDTDIILDLIGMRQPFYASAAGLFSKADRGEIQLCTSALSFANLNYILSRQYSAPEARKKIFQFKTLVTVLPVNDKIVELALISDFKDFEDGLQYFTATENGISILLTRNLKDYKSAEIAVMTASEFLKSQ
jgi:predicted nucleic acid-binding protein